MQMSLFAYSWIFNKTYFRWKVGNQASINVYTFLFSITILDNSAFHFLKMNIFIT